MLGKTAGVYNGVNRPADNVRVNGLTRVGSETGTSQSPSVDRGGTYEGLIVRRISSTITDAGSIVARSDRLQLERDGTNGGWRVTAQPIGAFQASHVNCIATSGGFVIGRLVFSPSGSTQTQQLFTAAQGIEYMQCSFGNAFYNGHLTQVTLQRGTSNSGVWIGTVTSTVNQ